MLYTSQDQKNNCVHLKQTGRPLKVAYYRRPLSYVLRAFLSSKSRGFRDEAYKSTLELLSAAVIPRRLSNCVSYILSTLPRKTLSDDDKRSLFPQVPTIDLAIGEIRRHE